MTMSLGTSILSALFIVCVVFTVLVLLWIILRIFGAIFLSVENSKSSQGDTKQPGQRV